MDCNEDEMETDSDEEDEDETGSSGSDEDESGDDDDDDSDSASEEEVVEAVEGAENEESVKAFSSDDDPERECCPICLNKFVGQDLATPESCDHRFCRECIKEWSKNINTCPIDRTEFNYIHLKASPGGAVFKKVKVKVLPKEPEDALEEIPTHCEICHSSDREDRLLLCDGCDLAYHCECLDPPLFYIPIEEWFCGPCSGVFDRRTVAGPSRSGTRRVIPRTRASETVRSRVQNLRSIRTPRSPSVSQSRKTTTTKKSPKKRKRRYYRKAIRKVVTLARTKKDMHGSQKGKLGARGSTVIVTYRRKYRRRRRKVKRKTVASSKALPSSKQRLARNLGIGKPLQGSTVPQIKKPTASSSRSSGAKTKLPSHSLFGNKDQLMDFSENFNEDMRDTSSLSKSFKRASIDECPSTSSGINLLDSIMADQKLLHSKSDKIIIKTDGSLILKDHIEKKDNIKKVENNLPSRTPMSIALVKQGVKPSLTEKNANTSYKKHADASKTKNASSKRDLKSNTDSKFENRSPANSTSSTNTSKLFKILNSSKERKSFLSATKNDQGIKDEKIVAPEVNSSSFTELNPYTGTGMSESKKTFCTVSETKNRCKLEPRKCSNSDLRDHPTVSSKTSTESYIKREIVSDEEDNNNISTSNHVTKLHIKQEILSDEETNIDSWTEHINTSDKNINSVIANIKKEPIESDLKPGVVKDSINLEMSRCILPENGNENDLSDFNASQGIINSLSNEVLDASQSNTFRKNTNVLKIKEEIPYDNEDYSQSLLLNSSQLLDKLSDIKKSLSIKKEPCDSDDDKNSEKGCHQKEKSSFIEALKSKNTFSSNLSKNVHCLPENQLASTQVVAPLLNTGSGDDISFTQALPQTTTSNFEDDIPSAQTSPEAAPSDSEDEMPCTQAFPQAAPSDSEDEMPCTQAFPQAAPSDSEDEMSCTQVFPQAASSDSEDDMPCTQALPRAASSDSDDDIPSAQAPPEAASSDSEDDMPCTQAFPQAASLDSEEDIPCTEAFPQLPAIASEDHDLSCTQISPHTAIGSENNDLPYTQAVSSDALNEDTEDSLPCTQAVLNISTCADDDDIPCTQIAFLSTKKSEIKTTAPSSFVANEVDSCEIADSLPPTQYASCKSKNKDVDNQVSNTKLDFEFKKPFISKDVGEQTKNKNYPSTSLISTLSESDLPSTQPVTFSTSLVLPTPEMLNVSSQEIDLASTYNKSKESINNLTKSLDFQIDSNKQPSVDDSAQVLPETQIVSPNSKKLDINDEQDDNLCKNNLNEIISNIKILVSSLSSESSKIQDLQNISNEMSRDELTHNLNNDNTSNDSMNMDETIDSRNMTSEELNNVQSDNSNSEGSKQSKSNISEKENKNDVPSSDDEEFSLEKFKESLKKSNPTTPKKFGIHKHLPQVITTIPVKENVKIKSSNKKTFSFQEVMKLERPKIEHKSSKNLLSKFEISDDKMFENSSSNDFDDSLPATQAVETVQGKNYKSGLLQPQNNKLGPDNSKQVLIRNHSNEHKHQFHNLCIQENGDLPATQAMTSQIKEKNSHLSSKQNDSKYINSSSSLNLNENSVEFTDHYSSAKKICDNTITNSERFQELSSNTAEAVYIKTHPNGTLKLKGEFENEPQMCSTSKRKNSFHDSIKNKKIRVKQEDCSDGTGLNKGQILNEHLKIKHEHKKYDEVGLNCVENSDNKHKTKQNVGFENASSSETNNLFKENCTRKEIKIKQEKEDFEFVKPFVNNVQVNSLTTPNSCLNSNLIKIEKVDPFDDFLPPTQAVNFHRPESNSLSHTQVLNADKQIHSRLPQSNLSLSQIKIEPIDDDDDDVAVIELDTTSNVKAKEIILIEDDDNENFNWDSNSSSSCAKQKEKLPSETIDISCIKQEKCLKGIALLESKNETQSLKSINSKKSENVNSKSLKRYEEMYDTAKSKHDCHNQKHIKLKNNRENTSSSSSKEHIKSSKNSHTSKEKDARNSSNQHTSKEKRKRDSKEYNVCDEKSTILKYPVPEEKNRTLEDLHKKKIKHSTDSKLSRKEIKNSSNSQPSQAKNKEKLKDSIKDKDKVKPINHFDSKEKTTTVDSKEKNKNKTDFKKNKDKINKTSKDTKDELNKNCSKEHKDKISKTEVLNFHPNKKNDLVDFASISKKIDKCESLSKHSEKSKDYSAKKDNSKSTKDLHSQNTAAKKSKVEKERHFEREKHLTETTVVERSEKFCNKDRRSSSEKENKVKNNKEVVGLKLVTIKRSHNDVSDHHNLKKRKLGHSFDSECSSNDDVSIQLPDFDNYSNLNGNMLIDFDSISNGFSTPKDSENAHVKSSELCFKTSADIKKIYSKQDLKEEIANEVKLVLKPFYNGGLISKEEYKDIMRRAVPKIFLNCHNSINPEKIRKLVNNYVSHMTNKS